jgi:hypothetical protein
MIDPLQPASFLPTTFTQAKGKLRSKGLFRPEGVTATAAGPELPIACVGNGQLMRYRMRHARSTIQSSKTIQSP